MVKKFFSLILILLTFLMFKTSKVNALSSDIVLTEFAGTYYYNHQYPIARYINGNSTGSYVVKIWSNINKPYFVLDVCTWGSMNFSVYNGDYTGSYFDDISYTINTNQNCSYENNTGTLYKIYLTCGLFDISGGSDGAGLCNSGWRFKNNAGYGSYYVIQDLNVYSDSQYSKDKIYYDELSQNQTIINQNQATNDKLDETNDNLNNIDDTLNNTNIDNPNFEEFEQYITENGVITQLITLPIRLYTQILNSINSTCTPFVLGEMFNHNLVMDCINPSIFFGSALWNIIDILGSGLFIYVISKKMVAVFHQFTNLEEGDILD